MRSIRLNGYEAFVSFDEEDSLWLIVRMDALRDFTEDGISMYVEFLAYVSVAIRQLNMKWRQ